MCGETLVARVHLEVAKGLSHGPEALRETGVLLEGVEVVSGFLGEAELEGHLLVGVVDVLFEAASTLGLAFRRLRQAALYAGKRGLVLEESLLAGGDRGVGHQG